MKARPENWSSLDPGQERFLPLRKVTKIQVIDIFGVMPNFYSMRYSGEEYMRNHNPEMFAQDEEDNMWKFLPNIKASKFFIVLEDFFCAFKGNRRDGERQALGNQNKGLLPELVKL